MNQRSWPQPLPANLLKNWLITARSALESVSDVPYLEAQMLAAFVLSKPKTWLLANPETSLNSEEVELLNLHLSKLVDGYPFAYISGEREFFGRKFAIQPGILVPRPETELLVETALHWLADHPARRHAVDAGCGSGCIAVSLAAECPGLTICAADINPEAVALTQQNVFTHAVDQNVFCLVADLLTPVRTKFDLICANLPYIPSKILDGLAVKKFEPILALDGGEDGLRIIERLLQQSQPLLLPGGLILLEIEASQSQSAQQLATRYFPQSEIRIVMDLSNHPRLLSIQS